MVEYYINLRPDFLRVIVAGVTKRLKIRGARANRIAVSARASEEPALDFCAEQDHVAQIG